jgi:hypothetical protein
MPAGCCLAPSLPIRHPLSVTGYRLLARDSRAPAPSPSELSLLAYNERYPARRLSP